MLDWTIIGMWKQCHHLQNNIEQAPYGDYGHNILVRPDWVKAGYAGVSLKVFSSDEDLQGHLSENI